MQWKNGRQLSQVKTAKDTVTYKYNINGLRTRKDNSDYTNYYYYDENNNLIAMMQGGTVAYFYYDSNNSITAMSLNNTMYYYIKNLQGDVTKIVDEKGKVRVEYTYDAWGNILKETANVDQTYATVQDFNPFRYRGYVYDTDTGLYYLQSRYYDPKTGRFINADDTAYVDTNSGTPLSTNMFAYCENNAVNNSDYDGKYAIPFVNTMLANALSSIVVSISSSLISIKAAIASSWITVLCIAAVAVAIVGIVYTVLRVRSLMAAANKTIASVVKRINSGGVNSKKLSRHSVYVIAPRNNPSDVYYVGRTKNFSRRKYAHQLKTGCKYPIKKYKMTVVATNLSLSQARVLEQTLITAYGIDTLKNMINSISPRKWRNFKKEYKQMKSLLSSYYKL